MLNRVSSIVPQLLRHDIPLTYLLPDPLIFMHELLKLPLRVLLLELQLPLQLLQFIESGQQLLRLLVDPCLLLECSHIFFLTLVLFFLKLVLVPLEYVILFGSFISLDL